MRTKLEWPRAIAIAAAMALFPLNACSDRISEPTAGRATMPSLNDDTASPVTRNVQPTEASRSTTSVRWSAITRDFIAAKTGTAKPNAVAAFRAFAYLSLAQYRAVVTVEKRHRGGHASREGAVAAA